MDFTPDYSFSKPEQENELAELPLFYREYKVLPGYVEYSNELVCKATFVNACFNVFFYNNI